MRPWLLDLFCGTGGISRGLQLAGFHVTGVDLKVPSMYAGDEFIQADALTFPLDGFDVICASPPCQASCSMRSRWRDREYVNLIAPIRARLQATGLPYVIENVIGAALVNPVRVCGSAFGLGSAGAQLRRHRLFESNVPLEGTPCVHEAPTIGVYGHPGGSSTRDPQPRHSLAQWREAMGIDWSCTVRELTEAIPPAFGEYIGRQLMAHIRETPPCT
jgi:DNA (cytosine-5)-methyltransferase 1